jgi:hypothetical protein
MLAIRWHRSSQEKEPTVACQGGGLRTRLEEGLCYWRQSNARRQLAESTPKSTCVAPLLDEKQWLNGRILALEKGIEGLRAPVTELINYVDNDEKLMVLI